MAKAKSLQQPDTGFASSTFRLYRRELRRYLKRRLHNPQDVEDVAQEVYIRLLRVDQPERIQRPLAFLYGIASHVVADFWHKSGPERFNNNDEVAELSEDPSVALPDDLADRLNLQQQIDRAFAQLPRTHAAVLLAHKRDGLSYEEVAKKLDLSIHTVEKYVTQAKARIRTMSWER